MKKGIGGTYYYVRDAAGNVMAVYKEQPSGTVSLEETHLYGSSRLGIAMAHAQADVGISIGKDYDTAKIVIFTRGEKFFELSNHLGNVLVTVSDKRLQYSSNGTVVSHYQADVTSANDYYPGGMQMPKRKYNPTGRYRYEYQGQETEKEFYDGAIAFNYRIEDPRIVRFLSVDPLDQEFPWNSPYAVQENKFGMGRELEGLELFFGTGGGLTLSNSSTLLGTSTAESFAGTASTAAAGGGLSGLMVSSSGRLMPFSPGPATSPLTYPWITTIPTTPLYQPQLRIPQTLS